MGFSLDSNQDAHAFAPPVKRLLTKNVAPSTDNVETGRPFEIE